MIPWSVVAQIGEDEFYPALDPESPRFVVTIDKPGSNHSLVQELLSPVFDVGLSPSQMAIDLVHLAAIVYTADLRIWRGYNGEDGWTREIHVYMPVADVGLWNAAASALCDLLRFLTGDNWKVHFRSTTSVSVGALGKPTARSPNGVCLFSGGLDSYVGAIDLLASGRHLALVGHYGNTQREQLAAYETLKPAYDLQMLPLWFYLVPPKSSKEQVVELTMRSRSILFLTLGTAVATALPGETPLYIPENGLISLNVPLTFGRTGTHSTRTTHPHTIALYRNLIDALGISVPIYTPYRFKTKGEMLRDCSNQVVLSSGIHSTMSCSHPQSGRFHRRPVGQHCGYCVPCIIRRAALSAVNLDDEQRNRDVLSADIRANEAAGQDKRAFLMAIARLRAMSDLEITSEILASGPVDVSDLEGLAGVFRRGMQEVEQFLGRTT
jgi:7-cyano-7-deazaguanine synthase in queuosine biosynthesis